MELSILLATWRRPDTLEATLEAFTRLEHQSLRWQVLVADNAGDRSTQAILKRFEHRLPLAWVVEVRRGKNWALNRLLPEARGDLLVFTDDDVLPARNWLQAMWQGSKRWPQATMFTGRILPSQPIPFDMENNFVRCAYMVAEWQQAEGPIRHDSVWGPNMAIRAAAFREGRIFNGDIGPNGTDYAMGSEIEFTQRLAREGHQAIYLPESVVTHQIRAEQLTEAWLLGRVYRSGRGVARLGGEPVGPRWFGRPRYLYRELIEGELRRLYWTIRGDDRRRLGAMLDTWHARGKAREYALMHSRGTLGRAECR